MTRFILPLVGSVLLLSACERATGPAATTGEAVAVEQASGAQLPIDTTVSSIGFRGVKVTGGHDGGFHDYAGVVTVSDTAVTGVDLTIRTPSIWTDTERLTNHLRSDDFFEVERFPEATFVSSQIVRADTAGATHLVTGNLTMHGVTQAITFPATIARTADGATAKASFVIDRTQWGIVYKGQADDLISNDVTISFDVTARNAAPGVATADSASATTAADAPVAKDAAPAAPEITTMQAEPQR